MNIVFTGDKVIQETESRILIDGKDWGRIMAADGGYKAQLVMNLGTCSSFFGTGATKIEALDNALITALAEVEGMKSILDEMYDNRKRGQA